MGGNVTMDLPKVLAVLKARKWLLVFIALEAAAVTLAISLTLPPRYEASADVLFGRTTAADSVIAAGGSGPTDTPERVAANNLALASLDTVAVRVKRRLRGDATVGDLKDAVSIESNGESDVVTVTAEWGQPRVAAAIANEFATQIVALRRQNAQAEVERAIRAINDRIAATPPPSRDQLRSLRDRASELEVLKALETGDAQVVERAQAPAEASSPRPLRNAVVAGVVGLILAAFIAVLLAALDQRVRDEDELVELLDAAVLARIPKAAGPRRLRSSSAQARDPSFVEAFNFLRLNLQLMSPARRGPGAPAGTNGSASHDTVPPELDRSLTVEVEGGFTHPALGGAVRKTRGSVTQALNRMAKQQPNHLTLAEPKGLVIAVTSPVAGDGKTTVVAWLAHSLAAAGAEVVAVDFDLRHPMLDVAFDLPRDDKQAGVLDALLRSGDAGEIAQPTGHPGLRVMRGGQTQAIPSGVVGRGRLQRMLRQVRQDADYVLVDTSPVTSVADASAVAAAADGVILVVDLGRARRKELLAAKQQLANAHAQIVGIVLNHAPADLPPYHAPEPRTLEPAPTA
jgi:capsular exopolysaccharide synthesis family protein